MYKYYLSTEMSSLINPPPHSKYLEKQKVSLEEIYRSHKIAPLGSAPATTVPPRNLEIGFGVPTEIGIPAVELIYPFKTKISQTSVYSEKFDFKEPNGVMTAGVQTPERDDSGKHAKDLLSYKKDKNSAIIIPSSSYAKKVDRDCVTCDCHGVDSRSESNYMKSKRADMKQHLREMLWYILKMKNHQNFKDLITAFKAYKNGNDKITLLDLQKMCDKFGISAPVHLLEELMEQWDIIDKDGALSYEEFIHSLTWKGMLPEIANYEGSKYANDWIAGRNNPSEDILDNYRTSTSFIGDHHKHEVTSKIAGLPSFLKNVDRTKLKGIKQFCEFGGAAPMIQPDLFSKYGVYEEDLSKLHTKEEIKQILTNSNIKFSNTAFETVWQNLNNNGKASIGKVWHALKKMCLSQ